MKSEVRLFIMFAGWITALCGVWRRSWPGTMIALVGLGLTEGAMTIGENLNSPRLQSTAMARRR